MNVDNEEMPSILHLTTGTPDSAAAASSDLPAGVEVFQEDSDRPYNKMVETTSITGPLWIMERPKPMTRFRF